MGKSFYAAPSAIAHRSLLMAAQLTRAGLENVGNVEGGHLAPKKNINFTHKRPLYMGVNSIFGFCR